MRTIIAGSRNITDQTTVDWAIARSMIHITSVVSGCAAGVDTLGEAWALKNGIPVTKFPAQWERYGRAAGPKRNLEMAKNADALIAVWDGSSRGTQNMIDLAENRGLRVFIFNINE